MFCWVHIWDEVNVVKEIENTMLIIAGGFGKRMLPLTEKNQNLCWRYQENQY